MALVDVHISSIQPRKNPSQARPAPKQLMISYYKGSIYLFTATSFQKERHRGLILNAAFSLRPMANQDHPLLGSVGSPFLFSSCCFHQHMDKEQTAVAMMQRKMPWQLRALHLSRGICSVASLQYYIDLQDFVKHLTQMEGFKHRMQDIDTIIFL